MLHNEFYIDFCLTFRKGQLYGLFPAGVCKGGTIALALLVDLLILHIVRRDIDLDIALGAVGGDPVAKIQGRVPNRFSLSRCYLLDIVTGFAIATGIDNGFHIAL